MQVNMTGPNIIIAEPSRNLRALGRNALADKWKIAVLAAIVYTLCMEVPPAILDSIFGIGVGDFSTYNSTSGVNVELYNSFYNNMPTASPISGIYTLLVTGAFELGITLFFLAMFRKNDVNIPDIFLGFERFAKALGLFLFQTLFIFLWLLLFIVPGIIAAIRYSQAFFIMADDPTKGIRQCMDESKAMMRGNKSKYFCLNISFIGWMLLAAIPTGLIEGIGTVLNFTGLASALLTIIAGLCMAPVVAYMYATLSGFYEILAGHLIKETEPTPVEPAAVPLARPVAPEAAPTSEPASAPEAAPTSEPAPAPEAAPTSEPASAPEAPVEGEKKVEE